MTGLGRRLAVLVAVVGVIVTLGAASAASSVRGVYWSMVQVHFIVPKSTENPNGLQISLRSLANVAGSVARMVDGSRSPRVVKPDMPLASQGILHGWSVQQPNRGGQWSNQYSDPYVTVQAVGSDPTEVLQTMQRLIGQVNLALNKLERESDVASVNMIRTQLSPPSVPLFHRGGSKPRALLATLALGFGITAALAALARRAGTRWQRRRSPPVEQSREPVRELSLR
jgi:hypothetical protein